MRIIFLFSEFVPRWAWERVWHQRLEQGRYEQDDISDNTEVLKATEVTWFVLSWEGNEHEERICKETKS